MPTSDRDATLGSKEQLAESLVRAISGFRPMVMGPICDSCNGAFQEGDTVYITAYTYWDDTEMVRKWATSRGHCADDAIEEASTAGGINAVVRAELGPAAGEGFPIYNPEVIDLTVPEGYDA